MSFKKTAKVICLTLTFMFLLQVTALADNVKTGIVTGDVVNVREQASTDAKILTKVYSGSTFEIVSLGEDWTLIEYKVGETGYIYNDFFKPVTPYKVATVTGTSVNIRAGQGLDAKVITLADKGNTFKVLNVFDKWVEIEYGTQTAFISADYVTVAEVIPEEMYVNEELTSLIVEEAKKHLGKPYVYGANGPSSFDCSGFARYVYSKYYKGLPRVAADQAKVGMSVPREYLQPGDLMFFETGGYVDHVGIYVGDGQMIHAGSTSGKVCYADINSTYFKTRFAGAKRII